jgi:hypothetical protein
LGSQKRSCVQTQWGAGEIPLSANELDLCGCQQLLMSGMLLCFKKEKEKEKEKKEVWTLLLSPIHEYPF